MHIFHERIHDKGNERARFEIAVYLVEKSVKGELYAHVFTRSVLFDIGIGEEKAFAREVVKLEKIVFGVGKHTVQRVDKAGNTTALHHNIGGVQVAVDKAGARGFFAEYIVEFLPCRLRRA